MATINFSTEMARQFALDIYDQLIFDIKKDRESATNEDSGTDDQNYEEGRAA